MQNYGIFAESVKDPVVFTASIPQYCHTLTVIPELKRSVYAHAYVLHNPTIKVSLRHWRKSFNSHFQNARTRTNFTYDRYIWNFTTFRFHHFKLNYLTEDWSDISKYWCIHMNVSRVDLGKVWCHFYDKISHQKIPMKNSITKNLQKTMWISYTLNDISIENMMPLKPTFKRTGPYFQHGLSDHRFR